MIFYVIRLKGTDKYVAKRDASYALTSDQWMAKYPGHFNTDVHWFTSEKYAKVWTRPAPIRVLVTLAKRGDGEQTYSRYEVIGSDGTITPLDDFIRKTP